MNANEIEPTIQNINYIQIIRQSDDQNCKFYVKFLRKINVIFIH